MNKAEKLHKQVMKEMQNYNFKKILGIYLTTIGLEQTKKDDAYLKWLACLVRITKPKKVVELGAARGISAIFIHSELSKDSMFYSCDIDPRSWDLLRRNYPNFKRIVGDDSNIKTFDGFDLNNTDIWFIDSNHRGEHLKKLVKLYTPFWKKGTILIFDDIHDDQDKKGMFDVFKDLPYDRLDITEPIHPYQGFGLAIC